MHNRRTTQKTEQGCRCHLGAPTIQMCCWEDVPGSPGSQPGRAASNQQVELVRQTLLGIAALGPGQVSPSLSLACWVRPPGGTALGRRAGQLLLPSSLLVSHFLSSSQSHCGCGWGHRREGKDGWQAKESASHPAPLLAGTPLPRGHSGWLWWGGSQTWPGRAPAYLDGVIGVRSFPMVWITLRPQIQRPVQIPTPP